jgi:DNA-binding MarR family transcriptional regulator
MIRHGAILDEYVDINDNLGMASGAMPATVPYETTVRVRDSCVCLHVQRAARALARQFDDALRPVGLTHGQFSLMMALNQPAAPSIGAVAALLAMDRTTLTAALKPLQRRRLVRVTPDPADRRSRQLALTAHGLHLLARAVPIWERTHREVEQRVPDGEPASLMHSLQRLSEQ